MSKRKTPRGRNARKLRVQTLARMQARADRADWGQAPASHHEADPAPPARPAPDPTGDTREDSQALSVDLRAVNRTPVRKQEDTP
jgi:hypothetical protein